MEEIDYPEGAAKPREMCSVQRAQGFILGCVFYQDYFQKVKEF